MHGSERKNGVDDHGISQVAIQPSHSLLPPSLGGSDGKESACDVGDLDLIPGLGNPLEKGIATHSSILAWRIPWTEETDGLQST